MKIFLSALFFINVIVYPVFAQELTQTVMGTIVQYDTEEPLPFVNVYIKDSNPLLGTTSDDLGNFILENVPFGRVTLEVSSLGFETLHIPEIIVTSAKTVQLNIKLTPVFSSLQEVVLIPKVNKQRPVNNIALVSARMFSVEETNRYAGGFDDPARLVSSFAGVASSNGGDNAIVIRGNAPKFLQWKIEGVEIPNPNHFANLSSFGGGGLTALNSNILANSDFMTGAFPAEYNNALAGVFDIRMRNGNSTKFEHSIEAGLIGIGLASEGPLNKTTNASYLVNYRYSTLALIPSLLPEDADGTKYQDLSFKLNFPSNKIGTFSLWGIGLIDESGTTPEKEALKREYYQDIENQKVKQYMGSIGINHRYFFKNSSSVNSTVAFTIEGIDLITDRFNEENDLTPENRIKNSNYNLTFKSIYNKSLSDKIFTRTGITIQTMGYGFNINEVDEQGTL